MTLSFFITVIPDHDKPQPPGCLLDDQLTSITPMRNIHKQYKYDHHCEESSPKQYYVIPCFTRLLV
ncbi:hypothetical protein F7N45_24985 [Escherichia coli]|nr:hypothetical protein [Escherichia coli]